MKERILQAIDIHLDAYNYAKIESIIDAETGGNPDDKELALIRSLAAAGQYAFGSNRIKEAKAYLKRSVGYEPVDERYFDHCSDVSRIAFDSLKKFVETARDEASKSSVGTVTDPAWKLVADGAATMLRIDERSAHIIEVLNYLLDLNQSIPGAQLKPAIDNYANFASTKGNEIKKQINQVYAGRGLTKQDSSACFVATTVYGDYDHPSVLNLRRFRDEHLRGSLFGEATIYIYYKIGPYLARTVSRNRGSYRIAKNFLMIFKSTLDSLIDNHFLMFGSRVFESGNDARIPSPTNPRPYRPFYPLAQVWR